MSARLRSVRTDEARIRFLFRSGDGPVGRDLDRRAGRVLAEARRRVGVDSGVLLASIRASSGRNARGQYRDITAGVSGLTDYLGYHMYGTGPHIIRARRRSTLRFVANGRVVYRRQVRHPGTRPNPFLIEALRKA